MLYINVNAVSADKHGVFLYMVTGQSFRVFTENLDTCQSVLQSLWSSIHAASHGGNSAIRMNGVFQNALNQ